MSFVVDFFLAFMIGMHARQNERSRYLITNTLPITMLETVGIPLTSRISIVMKRRVKVYQKHLHKILLMPLKNGTVNS